MGAVLRLLSIYDAGLKLASMFLLSALCATVLLGVVTRAMGDPLIWTDEVSRFFMVWLAAIGWMLATRRRSHIRIRFFQDLLPGRGKRGLELVFLSFILLFGVGVAFYAWELLARSHDLEMTTVPIPMSALYFPFVLAGLATIGQALVEAVEALRGAPPPAPPQANEDLIA